MPAPVSVTENATSPPRCGRDTVIVPPAGVARVALVTRLTMTRSIWLRSTDTSGRSGAASTSRRHALRLDLQPKRVDGSLQRVPTAGPARDRRDGARLDLRQIEQLAHQPIEPRRVVAAHLQDLLLPLVQRAGGALEQQVDAHLDAGQRRPQLVRRGGDELGLQPADLAQMGDVLEQRDRADQPVVGVPHRRRADAERPPGSVDGPRQHGGGALRGDRAACDRSTSVTACAMRAIAARPRSIGLPSDSAARRTAARPPG